jgi:hypothetical protein
MTRHDCADYELSDLELGGVQALLLARTGVMPPLFRLPAASTAVNAAALPCVAAAASPVPRRDPLATGAAVATVEGAALVKRHLAAAPAVSHQAPINFDRPATHRAAEGAYSMSAGQVTRVGGSASSGSGADVRRGTRAVQVPRKAGDTPCAAAITLEALQQVGWPAPSQSRASSQSRRSCPTLVVGLVAVTCWKPYTHTCAAPLLARLRYRLQLLCTMSPSMHLPPAPMQPPCPPPAVPSHLEAVRPTHRLCGGGARRRPDDSEVHVPAALRH